MWLLVLRRAPVAESASLIYGARPMKSTSYLGFVIGLGIAVAAACSPAVPPNNGDDGAGAAAPSASGSADIDTGAGAESSTGGAPAGGSDAGGAASTGSATSSGTPTPTSSGTGSSTPAPSAQTPVQLVAAGDADAGGKLFTQEHCDGCHGTKEKGPAGKFPNLYKMKWDDKQIDKAFTLIKKGKAPMPAYGDKLQDKQIGDIVAWLKKSK